MNFSRKTVSFSVREIDFCPGAPCFSAADRSSLHKRQPRAASDAQPDKPPRGADRRLSRLSGDSISYLKWSSARPGSQAGRLGGVRLFRSVTERAGGEEPGMWFGCSSRNDAGPIWKSAIQSRSDREKPALRFGGCPIGRIRLKPGLQTNAILPQCHHDVSGKIEWNHLPSMPSINFEIRVKGEDGCVPLTFRREDQISVGRRHWHVLVASPQLGDGGKFRG